ncbi:class I SAM-dependent methyltransferase [Mesorhizobium sp. YC-39]|uniref:class I SAM-dependent methyltransferase n=1 Tax=unclassified Mesorhizobium TaxID=325217 RepID=UPI0021E7A861|nr:MULTISPECIES: class I SAM-dependent methyltransferase [unclassified Mesorhizobium]MCV3210532.1 class I SAM-dependent methyltransferase [Mesorhizobium sp. YC-2]MCV3232570.1 class I SAM-dependent methyltransferase [Mesorhizobium sp. YC-39]
MNEHFLEDLDTSVFSVESATSENDKRSLLRLQKMISGSVAQYNYLEIGSDQGGSLVPILRDPNCARAISVDLRPEKQPDERGISFYYPLDGEARMLDNLQRFLPPDKLDRLTIFGCDIRDVDVADVPNIDLALVDGEHTNTACFSDADRMLDLVKDDSVIAFHDSNLIDDAIQNFERMLARLKIEHSTVLLPDNVGAIGLGRFAKIITDQLGPLSASRSEFFADAQLKRWISVANSIRNRGLLPDRTEELKLEISDLRFQLVEEKRTSEKLQRELEAARRQVGMLLQSTSWKVTAPLRYGAGLFKRTRR